jgi:hypothetical protein
MELWTWFLAIIYTYTEAWPLFIYVLINFVTDMRGYMTHKGIPDYHKSARHILKDYVSVSILWSLSERPPLYKDCFFCDTF